MAVQWLRSGMKRSVSVFMVAPQHVGSLPSCLLLRGHRMFGGGKREKATPPISVPYVMKAEAFSHYQHTAIHLLADPDRVVTSGLRDAARLWGRQTGTDLDQHDSPTAWGWACFRPAHPSSLSQQEVRKTNSKITVII